MLPRCAWHRPASAICPDSLHFVVELLLAPLHRQAVLRRRARTGSARRLGGAEGDDVQRWGCGEFAGTVR
eukprot:7182277-Pyramimonas_sp.AAC.1